MNKSINEAKITPFSEGVESLCIPISEDRFFFARECVLLEKLPSIGVGTLSEKSLHKMLKLYIEPNIENHEIKYLGNIADIKNEDGVFEIQTRAYHRLKPKLSKMLPEGRVTVVCPLSYNKWMRWIDPESGEATNPKKSPKHENIYDAMFHLFGIREFINHPNLSVIIFFLESEEYRALDGWDSTRKRGSNRMERIPTKLLSALKITEPSQYSFFLPDSIGDTFVASEFSKAIKRSSRFSYYVIKFLLASGVIEETGKRGRATLYSRVKISD